eukprot:TRINITY_DN4783_c0_g1_i2.p1 TRINITY_DN4783_c0_g1~~TRINITY_DN4783_c0_g1_i2.p1  ORF type:complete len:254 (-),score=55.57 TRINITY_DN4783_c0_g1_i2:70-831(-)
MARRFTATYTNKTIEPEFESKLFLYYCKYCGTYAVVLSRNLRIIPKRRTDSSCAVKPNIILKSNLVVGGVKVVKRMGSFERQYRYSCKGCSLWVGYKSVPFEEQGEFFYLIPDGLCQRQELSKDLAQTNMEELKAQLEALLIQFPEGIVTPNLRPLFKKQFQMDLNELNYGAYNKLIDLLQSPELKDIVKLVDSPEDGPDVSLIVSPNHFKTRTSSHTETETKASSSSSSSTTTKTQKTEDDEIMKPKKTEES